MRTYETTITVRVRFNAEGQAQANAALTQLVHKLERLTEYPASWTEPTQVHRVEEILALLESDPWSQAVSG